MRRNRSPDAVLRYSAECSRALAYHGKQQIYNEFPNILRAGSVKEKREHPEKTGANCSRNSQRNEVGLELAPAGPRLINDSTEENVIDNIPNTVDNADNALKSQADLKNVRDEAAGICIDIEALRHIVHNIGNRLFCADIPPVLINIAAVILLAGLRTVPYCRCVFLCQSITSS